MSARPWRVESRRNLGLGAGDWELNRAYGFFSSQASAEREVRKWLAASKATSDYRFVNRDTNEIIDLI